MPSSITLTLNTVSRSFCWPASRPGCGTCRRKETGPGSIGALTPAGCLVVIYANAPPAKITTRSKTKAVRATRPWTATNALGSGLWRR